MTSTLPETTRPEITKLEITLPTLEKSEPFLFDGLTWREFKAAEQLLDRPGFRLSLLKGVMEIRRI